MNVMDNEDTNGSELTESTTPSGRRSPACARCRNHNLHIRLSGHKRYCKYRYCMCRKCMETLARQKKMAKKTRQQRARKQDEDRKKDNKKKLPEEVDPAPFDAEESPEEPEPEPVEKKRKNNNLEILLEYSLKEMYHFRIAWPLISLVTTIVKYGQEYASEADIAEGINRISRVSIIRHTKIILQTIARNVILLFFLNLFPP